MRAKRLTALVLALLSAACLMRFGARQASAIDFIYQATPAFAGSPYYRRVKQVRLTGRQSIDILCVAASQLGYHEGDGPADIDGHNRKGTDNYTEYGYWFGTRVMGGSGGFYSAWCAFFVSWCARQTGVGEDVLSNSAYARPDGANSTGGYGYFHLDALSPAEYTPRSGDLVFIDWEADNSWDHVGFVLYCSGGRIGTIEGNAGDAVRYRVYKLDDPQLRLYLLLSIYMLDSGGGIDE